MGTALATRWLDAEVTARRRRGSSFSSSPSLRGWVCPGGRPSRNTGALSHPACSIRRPQSRLMECSGGSWSRAVSRGAGLYACSSGSASSPPSSSFSSGSFSFLLSSDSPPKRRNRIEFLNGIPSSTSCFFQVA